MNADALGLSMKSGMKPEKKLMGWGNQLGESVL
jgi:hypothetical protein